MINNKYRLWFIKLNKIKKQWLLIQKFNLVAAVVAPWKKVELLCRVYEIHEK